MTLKTDKASLRMDLEQIAADLRHAYSFLSAGSLVPEGQRNVAGLIERQIRRLETLMEYDDADRTRRYSYLCCPHCEYRTPTYGSSDPAARAALAQHLQRMKHGLSSAEAKRIAMTAEVVTQPLVPASVRKDAGDTA